MRHGRQVVITTPTASHLSLALEAAEHGCHLFIEKPLAHAWQGVDRLVDLVEHGRLVTLVGCNLRFHPGLRAVKNLLAEKAVGRVIAVRAEVGQYLPDWHPEEDYRKNYSARRALGGGIVLDAIHEIDYVRWLLGEVRSAVFRRLGTRPTWSEGFYEDYSRSGGALFDLHVHDADFVRFALGAPARVLVSGDLDHATTLYAFANGPAHVVAEGGWDHAAGYPFRSAYTAVFEQATVDYELNRTPKLLLARRGSCETVPIDEATGWEVEVRHFADAIAGEVDLGATCGQAVALTRMLEAERRSLESGSPVKTA